MVVLQAAHDVEHALRVAVGRVDDERVDLCLDQGGGALERVRPDPDGSGDTQASPLVLRRERIRLTLGDVLDRDQPLEAPFEVDDRQLLDPVPAEDCLRLLERRPDRGRDEPFARHRVRDAHRRRDTEAQVAIREDPDQPPVVVGDRDARDAVALHQLERVADEGVGRQRDGLDDHPGLRALDLVDLGDLVGDREVAVEHADAAERARARSPSAPR